MIIFELIKEVSNERIQMQNFVVMYMIPKQAT